MKINKHDLLRGKNENSHNMIMVECLDIVKYISTSTPIDNLTKCVLLEKHWVPSPVYVYQLSLHTQQGKEKRRNVLPIHLQNHWLVITDYMKRFVL